MDVGFCPILSASGNKLVPCHGDTCHWWTHNACAVVKIYQSLDSIESDTSNIESDVSSISSNTSYIDEVLKEVKDLHEDLRE